MAASHRYEAVEKLGQGATATVWKAQSRGQTVTIKVARNVAAVTALAREAIYAQLASSPRLPTLVEAICDDEDAPRFTPPAPGAALTPGCYLVQRWQPGTPLQAGQHAAAAVLAVARDLGEALASLHEAGIGHGDVKPQNALFDAASGRAALIDLGLAGAADDCVPQGGTPRYLGHGDRSLGSARARDLLALGVLLAELSLPHIAASAEPLKEARSGTLTQQLSGPMGTLISALVAPDPGSRPSARWVADFALKALGESATSETSPSMRVRSSYLRLRLAEVMSAAAAPDAFCAHWLKDVHDVVLAARSMCQRAGAELPAQLRVESQETLKPLGAEWRRRWLVSLVGSAATNWSLEQLTAIAEPELARGLERLAAKRRPELWSMADVEAALALGSGHASTQQQWHPVAITDVAGHTELALAVVQQPVDPMAIEAVEQMAGQAPPPLLLATADALRLSGQLGRAAALLATGGHRGAILADILRRSGQLEAARSCAEEALDDAPASTRALAVLARVNLDLGAPHDALAVAREAAVAGTAEVTALALMQRGQTRAAIAAARRGLGLASSAEERARLNATLAYVSHTADPAGSRRGYREAVAHAVRAGAVLEEASYRTGEASACVRLGELSAAIDTAKRAALLWDDVLQRPEMAARAWLSRAAALAAVDARHEALFAAREAGRRAQLGGDDRAQGYALLVEADMLNAGEPVALQAAERAAVLLKSPAEDAVRAAARLLRHGSKRLTAETLATLDQQAAAASVEVQLRWWCARGATALLANESAITMRPILERLLALAASRGPLSTMGQAMHVGAQLAQKLGDSDGLTRAEAARQRAAQQVLASCEGRLHEAASACRWLQRGAAPNMPDEQAFDLQHLVRALSERSNVQTLLERVVDVLLLWTRAERGLLLLERDGELMPEAARNLGRDDLDGEQLEVSRTLARRAFEERETVVAIDAMKELSDSHQSVHALKLRSVMALPLITGGEVLGVVYLDDRARRGAFGNKEVRWAQAVAPVAALAIADTRAQASLQAAVAQARNASAQLEEALANKESALAIAQRELAVVQGQRNTRFRYDKIIGRGEAMQKVLRLVDRVAPTDVPVLLRGESGTGKELLARALHQNSSRGESAFVGENCGALPETLLESVLFGHVRGAFTGANRAASGLFAAADGGTLFLDEIGEMSLSMQTKLLRVLEDGVVRPVGATRAITVDVRIIAATHRDLDEMVREGGFREDLYYRLNVITIAVPPLRDRRDDIAVLAAHFLKKHAPDKGAEISKAAIQTLMQGEWPGNVRQLENELRRALLMSDGRIDCEHLTQVPSSGASSSARNSGHGMDLKKRVDELERELLTEALEQTSGNQTQSAKLLGISRYGLHKMLKRLGMRD